MCFFAGKEFSRRKIANYLRPLFGANRRRMIYAFHHDNTIEHNADRDLLCKLNREAPAPKPKRRRSSVHNQVIAEVQWQY